MRDDSTVQRIDARTTSRDIAAFVFFAFIIRIAFLFTIERVIDMPDAMHYIGMARQFAAGEWLSFDENLPVLYPFLGWLAHLVVPNWEWAFWLVSLAASSLLPVPLYLLTKSMYDRRTARVAALLVCIWPWLADYGSRIASESLAVLLWFTSIWLMYLGIERGGWALYLAPVSFLLLHFARPEGTFLMLAAPFAALILAYGRHIDYFRRLAVLAIFCVALLGVYAVLMKLAIGTFTISYRAPLPDDIADYFTRGAEGFARTFLQLTFRELPLMLGPLLLMFLGIGLFFPNVAPRNVRLELVIGLFCLVQWGLTMANFSPAPRYVMAVVVALSLWSSRGMVVAGGLASKHRYGRQLQRWPVAAVVFTMALGAGATIVPQYLGRTPPLPREYKQTGLWMKANLPPGVIIARKPQVGFYADMPTVGPDAGDGPEEVVDFAKKIGARYLVVDERYTADLAPKLRPLLEPNNAPGVLRLLHVDDTFRGARVAVYEIIAPGIEYQDPAEFETGTSHRGPDRRRRKTPAP